MRLLVFLLIFANLLFLAYAQGYFGDDRSPDAARLTRQVHPERLQIVEKRGEVVAEALPQATTTVSSAASPSVLAAAASVVQPQNPPPVAVVAPPARPSKPVPPPAPVSPPHPALATADCTIFVTPREEAADHLAQQANIAGLSVRRRVNAAGGWWVYIPPFPSRQAASKKTSELHALGITEYFIMAEGPQQFAISLGVFSQEAAARTYLAQLRSKGVRSARVSARDGSNGLAQQIVEVRGDAIALMGLRASDLPDISTQECR